MIKAIDSAVRPRQQVMDITLEGKEGPSYVSTSSEPVDLLRVKKGTKYSLPKKYNKPASVLLTSGNSNVFPWQPMQKVLRRSP